MFHCTVPTLNGALGIGDFHYGLLGCIGVSTVGVVRRPDTY